MEEWKTKIRKLRVFLTKRDFILKSDAELKEEQIVLIKEAHAAVKAHENKEEAFQFWTDEFTGRY